MAAPNIRIANTNYTLASAAASGVSDVVSVALSAPMGNANPYGRVTTIINNPATLQGLQIEHRLVFTDIDGTSNVVPLFNNQLSSTLLTIGAGVSRAMVVEGVVGSALHIAVMAGSTLTSAVSGTISVWQH